MEKYFKKFKENTIGNELKFNTPYGEKLMVYADWVASGRLYAPIEKKIAEVFGPYVGNTHTETSETGTLMTKSYHYAQHKIKEFCNADEKDVIITPGSGMTTAINKFQRILGLRPPKAREKKMRISPENRPVVFVTHMEHHSNQISWYESLAEVVILPHTKELRVDLEASRELIAQYSDRKLKIGSFSAGSNVTGIIPPYYELAEIMHEYDGICFIDYAASAPYIKIDMHPKNKKQKLDAILFSPHKFLGGPGSSGVLIFDASLYNRDVPDNPGGGTVSWTNPWGGYKYFDDIEAREDGGTPGFLQAIRIALAMELKEQMGVENILKREEELLNIAFEELPKIPGMNILAGHCRERIGIVSFYVDDINYNLLVKLLNDKYGIQVRGGCACAGTYGHLLLDVSEDTSKRITDKIDSGDLSEKPGWVRLSLHPTMTDDELFLFINGLNEIVNNIGELEKDYIYNPNTNEYRHKTEPKDKTSLIEPWFKF